MHRSQPVSSPCGPLSRGFSARLLSLLLLALAPTLYAQSEPVANATFGEELSVVVVEVPVQVLRNGQPVRGLTRDDFELLDGGEPRELTDFEVIDVSSPEASGGEQQATRPGRNLLFMFDFDHSDPQSLKRAITGAMRLVQAGLNPRDRAAVGLYSGRLGPRLFSGFTNDPTELTGAFETLLALQDRQHLIAQARASKSRRTEAKAGDSPALSLRREESLRRWVEELGPTAALALSSGSLGLSSSLNLAGSESDLSSLSFVVPDRFSDDSTDAVLSQISSADAEDLARKSFEDAAVRSAIQQMRVMADGLGSLVTLLRDLEGPKHMLYFSQGLPGGVALASAGMAQVTEQLFARFRGAGWTIQAIDLIGITAAANGDIGADSPAASSDVGFASSAFHADSLLYLADGTGGEVFENYNRFDQATAAVLRHTDVTYLLSFTTPELPSDGRYHRLSVRLREGSLGTRVLHRPGYFAPRSVRDGSDLERQLTGASLLIGRGERRDILAHVLAVPVAGERASAAQEPAVAFILDVPGQAALSEGAGQRVDLEVQVAALDGQDHPVDLVSQRFSLDRARQGERLAADGLRFYGDLSLPAGSYRLRARLLNRETGKAYLGSTTLEVPPEQADVILLPPLFVRPESASIPLREVAAGASLKRYPFTLGEHDFVPTVHPSLHAGEGVGVCVFLRQPSQAGFKISARALGADGKAVAGGSFEIRARQTAGDGFERLIAHFSPSRLAPGEYLLEIVAEDPAGGPARRQTAPFYVEE